MCLLCIEWNKGNMTIKEAITAGKELINYAKNIDDAEHVEELLAQIILEEVEE